MTQEADDLDQAASLTQRLTDAYVAEARSRFAARGPQGRTGAGSAEVRGPGFRPPGQAL